MNLLQAIARAQRLTEQSKRQHIVLEEKFERHANSYYVTDGVDWRRQVERSPQHTARYKIVYPAVAP